MIGGGSRCLAAAALIFSALTNPTAFINVRPETWPFRAGRKAARQAYTVGKLKKAKQCSGQETPCQRSAGACYHCGLVLWIWAPTRSPEVHAVELSSSAVAGRSGSRAGKSGHWRTAAARMTVWSCGCSTSAGRRWPPTSFACAAFASTAPTCLSEAFGPVPSWMTCRRVRRWMPPCCAPSRGCAARSTPSGPRSAASPPRRRSRNSASERCAL